MNSKDFASFFKDTDFIQASKAEHLFFSFKLVNGAAKLCVSRDVEHKPPLKRSDGHGDGLIMTGPSPIKPTMCKNLITAARASA